MVSSSFVRWGVWSGLAWPACLSITTSQSIQLFGEPRRVARHSPRHHDGFKNRETSCDRHPRDLGTAGIIDRTMSRVPWSLCQEAAVVGIPRLPEKGISGRPTGDAIQQAPATLSSRGSKPGNRQAEANIRPLSAGQRQVVCSESHTKKDRSPCSIHARPRPPQSAASV